MRRGDELLVVKEGIRIPSKSLEPLGIYDGSRCWGLWVHGQREEKLKDRGTTRAEAPMQAQAQNLVVSPIHPDYWASVFHLEIKLTDRVGALAEACGVLKDCGVNIVFADCANSGYKHATLSAVCELDHLRQRIGHILAPEAEVGFQPSAICAEDQVITDDPGRERKFKEIGTTMLLGLAELEARIRLAENELWRERRPFLYSPIVEVGPQPWFLPYSVIQGLAGAIRGGEPLKSPWLKGDDSIPWSSADLDETLRTFRDLLSRRHHTVSSRGSERRPTQEALEVEQLESRYGSWHEALLHHLWRAHWVEPVSLRTLLALSYYRIWSRSTAPVQFRYDAQKKLLCPDEPEAIKSGLKESGFHPYRYPSRVLASSHKLDRFVRFRFFRRSTIRKALVQVQCKYEAKRSKASSRHATPPAARPALSPGLMLSVSEALVKQRCNVLSVNNHLTEFSSDREHGVVRLVGAFSTDQSAELRSQAEAEISAHVEALRRENEERFGRDWLKSEVSVEPLPESRLFLSMPADAVRGDRIREVVKRCSDRFGYELVHVQRKTGSELKQWIRSKIEEADVFVQVVVLRAADRDSAINDEAPELDYGWIKWESSTADFGRKRYISLVDRAIPARVLPKMMGELDTPRVRLEFDTQHEELGGLRTELDEALAEIRRGERSV